MQNDEQAIRDLIDKWLAATKAGDYRNRSYPHGGRRLFLIPGHKPFGKQVFAANSESVKGVLTEGTSEIEELKILGDWAWMRTRLRVKFTPPGGKQMVRSGYTLTILRKEPDGRWVLLRDANLLTPE